MKKNIFLFFLICFNNLLAQQLSIPILVRDDFITIATDARAAGQGDIGVATSVDAFSQNWNPSKYIFSEEKIEIGLTNIVGSKGDLNEFNQINLSFYNRSKNEYSAYGLSFKGYAYEILNGFRVFETALELSIDGSYTLKLSNEFAMSVAGRVTVLENKLRQVEIRNSLFSVDVSGFYNGKKIRYKKFRGRWRAGFNFSNLRGTPSDADKGVESYAPTSLKVGTGFDFIFSDNETLGVTTKYKMLLDSYDEDANGEKINNTVEGSVIALGLEFTFRKKIAFRTGYSHGINRLTDSFLSVGTGIKTKSVDVDIAGILLASEEENPIRQKLRVSLIVNINQLLFPKEKIISAEL